MSIPRKTRDTTVSLWAVVVVVTLSGLAAAQPPPGPVIRPTVSPYLNLLQGTNNNPAASYYGVIRPVQDLRRQNTQLANQFGSLQGQVSQAVAGSSDLPATGHAAGFMNAGSYFLNVGTNGPTPTPIARPTNPTLNNSTSAGGTPPPTRR